VVEKEMHLFLEKWIVTLSPDAHIKLDTTMNAKSHCFSLLPSCIPFLIHCLLHRTSSQSAIMTNETDQISLIAGDATASCSKAVTGSESHTTSALSSSNIAKQSIAKKKAMLLFEY
jgi:hypothetical protein